jgi:hypothetical protein
MQRETDEFKGPTVNFSIRTDTDTTATAALQARYLSTPLQTLDAHRGEIDHHRPCNGCVESLIKPQ